MQVALKKFLCLIKIIKPESDKIDRIFFNYLKFMTKVQPTEK